ncbi:Glutamate 5-kinase [Ascochyta rabiei]|uniref:Glutamate 5-kinase n=1 Tax=Didymella rabiei TaxID=5454 RepID=UPI0019011EDB|nr:Glutamate 5-kinase [Ascochyta rabiei]UPX10335.1 Glutamate 5-kinase [Ascochyta rabiei]
MVQASFLFLLTDVDSLYATNPKHDPHAESIAFVTSVSSLRKNIDSDLGAGTPNGTGGMETKLRAAEIASAAGFFTVIASSAKPGIVTEILEYYKTQRLLSGGTEFKSLPDDSSESEDDARPPHTIFLPNTNAQFAPPFAVGEALTPSSL